MSKPGVRLTLSGENILPAHLAQMTRDLLHDLERAGAGAKLAEREPRPGERSMALELFTIALTILEHTSGHIAADYIKKHLAREKTGRIRITDAEGRQLAEFDSSSIEIGALAALLKEHVPPAQ
jgi:hypothetical protein